jgi:hypothetical protein
VEKPYHTGLNRAWVYGKGVYLGVTFGLVNLTLATASATAGNATISGVSGTSLSAQTVTLTLTNASVVRGGLSDADASSWFDGLPSGVTVKANGSSLSNTITLTFGGTPTTVSTAAMSIEIPTSAQTSGAIISVTSNANAKFAVTAAVTAVAINNTAPSVGSVLSATLTPSAATVTYSWKVNGIEKGTSATYTVVAEDVGYTITLTVTGTGAYTGTVSSAATSAVTSANTGVLVGDVNGDGLVNAIDTAYLARYLAGWAGYPLSSTEAADVNGDGAVNAIDTAYLARHLAGWAGYPLG